MSGEGPLIFSFQGLRIIPGIGTLRTLQEAHVATRRWGGIASAPGRGPDGKEICA